MRRAGLVAVEIVLALALAGPTIGADRIGKPGVGASWDEQAVMAAAGRMLSTMPEDAYQIDPAALSRLIETGAPLLIDVRERSEWQTERISGTLQVALRSLPEEIDRLQAAKDQPIVVICQAGVHGTMAMTVLRMLGYTNVRNLRGGVSAWKAAGFGVVRYGEK